MHIELHVNGLRILLPAEKLEIFEQASSTKTIVVTQNYQGLHRREVDETYDEVVAKMHFKKDEPLGKILDFQENKYFANY